MRRIKIYVFDIETLNIAEDSVILSMGCVYLEDYAPKPWEDLLKNSIFIKLDAVHQIKLLNRTASKSTLEWWSKQSTFAKNKSLNRSSEDLDPITAIQRLRKFVFDNTRQQEVKCFTRGFMDVMTTEHLAKQVDQAMPWRYNNYRDVRTAIDILYPNSKNGYVEVDTKLCAGYNQGGIIRHDPVIDCAEDAAMILYGKTE